jgi:hypothetical protein
MADGPLATLVPEVGDKLLLGQNLSRRIGFLEAVDEPAPGRRY